MPNSRIGIKRCLISPSGRMLLDLPWAAGSGTPATTWAGGLISIGSRKPSKLIISPLDELTDYRNRKLRNKMNFKYEVDSFQLRMRDLDWLNYFVQSGYDIQIVKERLTSAAAASGGVFNWLQQFNGLGFDYVMTNKERFCKIRFETALEYANAITLIDASDSYSAVEPVIASDPQSGGNERGENLANYAYPWYFAIEAPDATAIFSKKEIIERSFTIKTSGPKNEYNEEVVNFYDVELKIKGTDATIDKIKTILSKDMSPSVTIKEYLTAAKYEKFVFLANTLTHSDDFELGDEQDFSQLTFTAKIALDQITWLYGAANGGTGTTPAVEEAGTTEAEARQGGTFTFGDAEEEE